MRAVCYLATALALWLCVTTPQIAGEIENSSALARALMLPDGSPVQLTGLLVDKVVAYPPYAVVRDAANNDDRLIVLLSGPPDLRRWQTIDVVGVLTTLPNGCRALTKCDLSTYADLLGVASLAPIPAAGYEDAWPFRLPVALDTSAETHVSARGGQMMLDSEEKLPVPDPPVGGGAVFECEQLGAVQSQTDGTVVRIHSRKIAGSDNEPYVSFKIAEDDEMPGCSGESCTLKVYYKMAAVSSAHRLNELTGTVRTEGTVKIVVIDERPGFTAEPVRGLLTTAAPNTVSYLKTLPSGRAIGDITEQGVSVGLTAGVGYIQDPHLPTGIRVVDTNEVPLLLRAGDGIVIAEATVLTDSGGERYIAGLLTRTKPHLTPATLTMLSRAVGGAGWAYVGATGAGQQGLTMNNYGSGATAAGANNVGLRVRVCGRVTAVGQGYYVLDDGSAVGEGNNGLRIEVSPFSHRALPSVEDYVIVTGAAGLYASNGERYGVLRTGERVLHVKPTGNDANNGFTWATAKQSVQGAVNAADSATEIWVAAGTFSENIVIGDPNVGNGPALYGGFAGHEQTIEERNVAANATILDGGASGPVVYAEIGATGPSPTIDGFTIRNGKPHGVELWSSNALVANNVITDNVGGPTHFGGGGGGLYAFAADVTIAHNRFANNTAAPPASDSAEGGAVFLQAGRADVDPNWFEGNSARGYSGHAGALATHDTTLCVTNNVFANNDSYLWAGAVSANGGAMRLLNNTFVGNWLDAEGMGNGGAVTFAAGGPHWCANNLFYDNHAPVGNSVSNNTGTATHLVFCDAFNPGAGNTLAEHYSGPFSSDEPASLLFLDPVFADISYRLLRGTSPCIDKGRNPGEAAPFSSIPLRDKDGRFRPCDIPEAPNYGAIDQHYSDIGAYEVQN